MIFKPILPIFIVVPFAAILIVLSFLHKKPFAIKSFVRAGIAILLAIILARPMVTGIETESQNSSLDVVFVVDTTLSMRAEDYNGKNPRINGVKDDLLNIMDKLKNARYSLVTFSNYPRVVTPLSSDTMTLKREVTNLKTQNSYYARGTDINDVKENLQEILESARQLQEDAKATGGDARQTIVFFFGDGEFTRNDSRLGDFSNLKKFIDSGYVFGYGTSDGGAMKGDEDDYYRDSSGYVQDTSNYPYKRGISKIDEDSLKKLAKDTGLEYIHAETHSSVTTAANTIQALARTNTNLTDSASDIYFIFVIPLLVLLTVEIVIDKRSIV